MTRANDKFNNIIDALAQSVSDYAYANGYKKLILLPMGLAAFLAALGFATSSSGIKFSTVLILIATQSTLILVLLLDRRVTRRINIAKSRVMNNYVAQLTQEQQINPNLFEILEWDETSTISANGDVIIHRWFTIKNGATPIRALWSKCNKIVDDQDKPGRQAEPDVRANQFDIDESGSRVVGPRLIVTHNWVATGEQIAFIHFSRDIAPGEEVRFRLIWDWPRFYENLIDGHSEPVYWIFRKKVHNLRVAMHFEKGCSSKPLTTASLGQASKPTTSQLANGATDLSYVAPNPPTDEKFGFIIDFHDHR